MDARSCLFIFLVLLPVVFGVWRSSDEDRTTARHPRRGVHSHSKRHMLPVKQEVKKTTVKPRELRKKPSGHLAPLEDDDMDNDEVVSVAIGPPPIRPKYDKVNWKHNPTKQSNSTKLYNNSYNNNAVHFVRDVLTQLGREFLQNQVNEDYVFGQYVGNSMKNLTNEIRLNMQHEILDIIMKYQKINRGEAKVANDTNEQRMKEEVLDKLTKTFDQQLKETKIETKKIVSHPHNDTEEGWPDFTNLEKIVG